MQYYIYIYIYIICKLLSFEYNANRCCNDIPLFCTTKHTNLDKVLQQTLAISFDFQKLYRHRNLVGFKDFLRLILSYWINGKEVYIIISLLLCRIFLYGMNPSSNIMDILRRCLSFMVSSSKLKKLKKDC